MLLDCTGTDPYCEVPETPIHSALSASKMSNPKMVEGNYLNSPKRIIFSFKLDEFSLLTIQ